MDGRGLYGLASWTDEVSDIIRRHFTVVMFALGGEAHICVLCVEDNHRNEEELDSVAFPRSVLLGSSSMFWWWC